MRTLRGGNANNAKDKESEATNGKDSKKDVDDDVGANGDDTTDDEGGVDTPPPREEDEEDSKGEEKTDTNEESTKPDENEVEENGKSGKKDRKEKDKKKKKEKKGKVEKKVEEKKEEEKKEEEEEEEYEVEQIVDMEVQKRRKCPVNFRVRWMGYSEKEDSWLPASELSCEDLVQDFLEISGRKSEYDKAFESKKRAAEMTPENCRQSARKVARITYSELDEDEDEILPSGTRTRKVKTKAEKKEMPNFSSSRKSKKKKKGAAVAQKVTPRKEDEFEVEKIVDHRVKGRFTDYKIRWKGYGPKHDSWIQESELNCPNLIKSYNKTVHSSSGKEEEFEVESIAGMRETKGRVEYKVRWKNWGPKYDSWLPEDELSCSEILTNFKKTLEKLEQQKDWQVEHIVDTRERRGKTEYLIHWQGFESKFDSWEPEDNLEGCKDVLDKYKHQKEKEKEKILKSGRKTRDDRNRPERYVENFTGGSRSKSKRKSAGTSYSEFYNQ